MNTSEEYWENKLRETVQDYEFSHDPTAWAAMNGLLNQLPPLGAEGSATPNSAAAGKAGSMLGGLAPKLVAVAVYELVVGLLMVGYIGVIVLTSEPAATPPVLPQYRDTKLTVPLEISPSIAPDKTPDATTISKRSNLPRTLTTVQAIDTTAAFVDTTPFGPVEATPKTLRIDLLPARPLFLPQSLRRKGAGIILDSLSLNFSPKIRSRKTLYPDVINNY